MICVTAKVNPDLDGTACACAYADFLNQQGAHAKGIIFGSPQSEVSYFSDQHGIVIPNQKDEPSTAWGQVVLVDASSMKGMPKAVIPERVIEIIDHRSGSEPEQEFPNARVQNEMVGAAATLVTERFMQQGLQPSREHALLLYGAIHHNSLNFLATNTQQRDHDAAAFLARIYGFDTQIIEDMFRYATSLILADPARALEDDGKEFGKGYTIGAYQLIVWGDYILHKRSFLEDAVRAISKGSEEEWAILNIIDVAEGVSFVYVTESDKIPAVALALGTTFEHGWATLEPALLRKQIMPLISSVIPSAVEGSREWRLEASGSLPSVEMT